jgi:hypothetical protein
MQTLSVEILNPKAISLLNNLEDLKLILIKKKNLKSKKNQDLKSIILSAPTWSEKDELEYEKIKNSINKVGNAFT